MPQQMLELHTLGNGNPLWKHPPRHDQIALRCNQLSKFIFKKLLWMYLVFKLIAVYTIILVDQLKVLYWCLSNSTMKVEHIWLSIIVPNWRFVVKFKKVVTHLSLPPIYSKISVRSGQSIARFRTKIVWTRNVVPVDSCIKPITS